MERSISVRPTRPTVEPASEELEHGVEMSRKVCATIRNESLYLFSSQRLCKLHPCECARLFVSSPRRASNHTSRPQIRAYNRLDRLVAERSQFDERPFSSLTFCDRQYKDRVCEGRREGRERGVERRGEERRETNL